MSTAILEQAGTPGARNRMRTREPAARQPSGASAEFASDWEMAAGPSNISVRARSTAPQFHYRGYGDAHWRGQSCYLVGSHAAQPEHRTVIMACGCKACVPWWTLDPILERSAPAASGSEGRPLREQPVRRDTSVHRAGT
jgi:hypothetical protein